MATGHKGSGLFLFYLVLVPARRVHMWSRGLVVVFYIVLVVLVTGYFLLCDYLYTIYGFIVLV